MTEDIRTTEPEITDPEISEQESAEPESSEQESTSRHDADSPTAQRSSEAADDPSVGVATAEEISGAVEALLLMSEEPVAAATLAGALEVPLDVVTECLADLQRFYDETNRGFELRHLGGGWRYYTRERHADVIAAYVLQGQQARLSQAALETLAVIAYQQPISRARVSAVRGVNVDGVIRTLVARSMIEEAGQDEVTGAIVFRTTDEFLERMGLHSLTDLPPLAPHLPEVSELEAELGQLAVVAEPNDDNESAGTPADDEGASAPEWNDEA